MNSTLLRILAVLLAVGALLMGWSGYRMSMKSAQATQQKALPQTYPQVVAMRDIPAGAVIEATDVGMTRAAQNNPQGYASTAAVIGRMTQSPIRQGATLLKTHFPVLSSAAQSLQPGERAVAVKVNEVVGVGGVLSPGDHVDVLLYLHADRETGNASSVQVILRDARVLAYGDNLGEAPPAAGSSTKGGDGADATKKRESKPEKDSRSAILAVPEKDAARLVLADSAGQLRLALRGVEPPPQVRDEDAASHFTKLEELARAGVHVIPGLNAAPTMVRSKAKPPAEAAGPKLYPVIVHNGDHTEVMRVSN